jgi:serine/threonine-protein kinase
MTDDLERSAGVTAGEILAEKYRVERVLGVGGMGVVVAARHIELDERVALKFLLPGMLLDGTAVARFQREARAAVRIKNEHVARVFDVGRLPNGAPYMVMEFLEGLDLAARLQREGPMPVWQAVDFVVQACVAVADAHSLGIIHRDLKPANLFCVRRSDGQPSIKVLDFGISKLADPGAGMSFTQTSATMGSPLYMSPEQFRSTKNVDARTDIWALGAILFELITGSTPFTATTVPELAIRIATETAPSAAAVRRDVPPALAAVIAKCLEREPDQRFHDVGELTLALSPFASPASRPLVDRVMGILGTPSGVAATTAPSRVSDIGSRTAPALQYTAHGAPRRNVGLTVLGGAVVVLGAIGVGWWQTQAKEPAATTAPSAMTGDPVLGVVQASGSDRVPAPPTGVASAPAPPPPPSITPVPAAEVSAGAAPGAPGGAPVTAGQAAAKVGRVQPVARKNKAGAPSAPQGPAAAAQTPAAPAPPPPAAAPRVSCDPPFYFDSRGNRVFKQECL